MKSGPREGFRWTRETIAYAIDLWHREHLRTPTVDEWEAAAQNHPCRQTVLRVFGSWNAAMEASGFRARGRGVTREPWSRRRCPQSGRWLPSD